MIQVYACNTVIVARIADMTILVTSLLSVSTVFLSDFGRCFYIFTVRRRNSWLALTEPLGSAESLIYGVVCS